MQDPFLFADDIGPAKVIHIHDSPTGLRAVVVVDNVAMGPAVGGVRMAPDVTAEEAFRLARAMTFKNAAAGLPHGGAKSVIFGEPSMPARDKERLIRVFATAIRELSDYIPGPDMGTDEICMAWVRDEIGRALGLPRELGGIPLDEIGATGWGVFHAIQVGLAALDLRLKGARVVIQGFGAVGGHAARFLAQQGAVLVGAANIEGALYNPGGLDVARLMELRAAGRSILEYPHADKLDRDAVLDMECEIWIPAARPDVVNEANVQRLKTRLVAQGANIPFTAGAERWLHERGVLVLPDFIANAGGVICAAVEYKGGSETTAFQSIQEKVRRNTQLVLDDARKNDITPREAAVAMARRRVLRAMSFRRWGDRLGGVESLSVPREAPMHYVV